MPAKIRRLYIHKRGVREPRERERERLFPLERVREREKRTVTLLWGPPHRGSTGLAQRNRPETMALKGAVG